MRLAAVTGVPCFRFPELVFLVWYLQLQSCCLPCNLGKLNRISSVYTAQSTKFSEIDEVSLIVSHWRSRGTTCPRWYWDMQPHDEDEKSLPDQFYHPQLPRPLPRAELGLAQLSPWFGTSDHLSRGEEHPPSLQDDQQQQASPRTV